jgi:hypothetical protein
MKRTLLILAFIASAGSAGAQTPATGAMNPDTRMNTQMNSGSPANGSAGADMATAPADMTGAAATARKRIEMDGYKDVQGLAKGADGLWHGTALRGHASVQVTVDRAGRVAAQ